MWAGNHVCLVLAIQYAVMIRTDDRRMVTLSHPAPDMFLGRLIHDLANTQDGHTPVSKIRIAAGRAMARSWWSVLFENIEIEAANKTSKPPDPSDSDEQILRVRMTPLIAYHCIGTVNWNLEGKEMDRSGFP
jgi:hypothetical protein